MAGALLSLPWQVAALGVQVADERTRRVGVNHVGVTVERAQQAETTEPRGHPRHQQSSVLRSCMRDFQDDMIVFSDLKEPPEWDFEPDELDLRGQHGPRAR